MFINVSVIDVTLSQCQGQQISKQEYQDLLNTRYAAHRDLLSLPSWKDLDEATKLCSHSARYETCRLTSILYSNAVLLGLPPHTGWHRNLVCRLRMLLELCSFNEWAESSAELLTWALFVGGIASYRTQDRNFFEHYLSDILVRSQTRFWPKVRHGLQEFIWSDSAYEHGAAVLWDSLDLSDC